MNIWFNITKKAGYLFVKRTQSQDKKSQLIFFDLEKPLGQKVTGQKVTINIVG
jgi:hypothetical protein